MMPLERHEELARASATRAQRDRGVGLMLIVLGIGISVVVFLVLIGLSLAGRDLGSWPNGLGFVLVPITLALVARGRRMRVRGAERVLAEDPRPPIVYLRSFGADSAEIKTRMSSRVRITPWESVSKTYEQRLAHALHKIGPFVAVGNPTEGLPLLGAARAYAADEDWQETVDELTDRAGIMILHAGEGEGFGWEVHHVLEYDTPERVIVSLPLYAKRKEPSRQERYDGFRRMFGDVFPRPLPETIGHCQFMYFDADWTPRLLGERGATLPSDESERTRALRSLAGEFKITWGPLWLRWTVYFVAFLAGLWAVETLVSAVF
jgi:hypothetical protein